MTRLALLTLADRSDYVIDDDVGIAELTRRGLLVEEIPWNRPGVDWRAYDGVVIRTPWDYQRHLDSFLAVLERIESLGVPLANPLSLVRWNARKTYLLDLERRQVPIVPTLWGRGLTTPQLRAFAEKLEARECVVKPVVSANADDTYRISDDLSEATAREICARFVSREWMAEPFVTSILDEGEDSLIYFHGELSHAVRKRPKAGDFRVQEEHGGVITPFEPGPAHRKVASIVLAALGDPPFQARVDLVRLADGSLAVMELEAIEPSLYFRMDPRAPAHFADAVQRWLADPTSRSTPPASSSKQKPQSPP
jgi:glutathione synthase/RimK-type ligase-like ATP-grasp enzyme